MRPSVSIGWNAISTVRKGTLMTMLFEDLLETWSMDREIVLVKVLKHPRAKVFAAWMDPAAL